MSPPKLHERMLRHLTPEQALVVEVLRQALHDAQHPDYCSPVTVRYPATSWQGRENHHFREARDWLVYHEDEVRWWLDLLDVPETCYAMLLEAAGLLGTTQESSSKPPAQAIQELRALVSPYFDGVDPHAYVAAQREDVEVLAYKREAP